MFELGKVVVTRNCLEYSTEHNVDLTLLLMRHANHDWGDLCKDDKRLNDLALCIDDPGRIFSAYIVDGKKFYIITEFDRSSTCIMLAEDY